MEGFVIIGLVVVLLGLGVVSLWDRFRPDDLPERLLNVPGLEDLCQEYLDLIRRMNSGQFDLETLALLDSERQSTHEEILRRLGLDRSSNLDVERFARRYLYR